ncbi:hypothetical protein DEU56DRAFT_825979 [Suillus clintonianus]|uniref:uncharacterized protein n=1 Tax=Suillus clintonianus TaxID=1904413 RepID=UPI001B877F26|nr:uncharacterized protein DEU56DRAFT_825979 [Suillus clintonianus]KAG2125033.1 hypothetical protein DEU56DRAFT_825979 [Suillus clintonianus]
MISLGEWKPKGCAKPAAWKDARRYFYWALRARIARSDLLEQIEDGNPEMSAPCCWIHLFLPVTCPTIVLWPKSLSSSTYRRPCRNSRLIIYSATLRIAEVAEEDRKASLDGLVRIIDSLPDDAIRHTEFRALCR